LPSRAPGTGRCGDPPGVGLEAGEDGVADAPLETAERLFVRLALGELAVVISPSVASSPIVTAIFLA
jgi:hypothetical protein